MTLVYVPSATSRANTAQAMPTRSLRCAATTGASGFGPFRLGPDGRGAAREAAGFAAEPLGAGLRDAELAFSAALGRDALLVAMHATLATGRANVPDIAPFSSQEVPK